MNYIATDLCHGPKITMLLFCLECLCRIVSGLCRWPLRLFGGRPDAPEYESSAMYSSVAAHHNFKGGGEKRSSRQQQLEQQQEQQQQQLQLQQLQQQQQQQQQVDQNNKQEDGGATRRRCSRHHHHHHHHQSFTTRVFNYIKQQLNPEKDTGEIRGCIRVLEARAVQH